MSALRSGRVIGERWALDQRLGRGGMGEVWRARHQSLRQPVAIKILDRDAFPLDSVDEARSRFDLEARIAAKLARKTRHIVTVVDNGRDGEIDYLVMELLEGESLDQVVRAGPLDPALVTDVVRQAARGLTVAHADGVIHRDLKPSNLFLTVDENGAPLVKLLDFGIAKAKPRDGHEGAPSSHRTRTGVIMGTAQFMSPEQARGLSIDTRADVWALAAVAYELLTAHPPHEAESHLDLLMKICTESPPSPRVWRSSLPASVDAVFARAFARSLDDRYQDARSFADALAAALESALRSESRETHVIVPSNAPQSVVGYVATHAPTVAAFAPSRRRWWIASAIVLATLLAGSAIALRRPERAQPRPAAQPVNEPATPSVSPAPTPSAPSASVVVVPSASAPRPRMPLPHAPKPAPADAKKTDKSEIL